MILSIIVRQKNQAFIPVIHAYKPSIVVYSYISFIYMLSAIIIEHDSDVI